MRENMERKRNNERKEMTTQDTAGKLKEVKEIKSVSYTPTVTLTLLHVCLHVSITTCSTGKRETRYTSSLEKTQRPFTQICKKHKINMLARLDKRGEERRRGEEELK